MFANYLHPVAFNEEKKRNPAVKASDAWGFVPPPLIGEGEKVQTRWLHDFLLEPFAIRPAAVLRMPKFHMTSDEAQAIVHHFAALDNVDYPYEFDRRLQGDYLSSANAAYETTKKAAQAEAAKAPPPPAPAPGATAPLPTVPAGDKSRLDDAMTLVTDNGFCVKCHLVGDFRPAGASAGLAPNLAGVATRLRPDYLKKWIANPGRILPYTGMPVNFPKTQSVAQNLFKGTSEQQIDGVVDFLLNYDRVMSEKTRVVDLMKTAAVTTPAGTPASGAPAPVAPAPAGGIKPATPAPANPAPGNPPPARPTLPGSPAAGEE